MFMKTKWNVKLLLNCDISAENFSHRQMHQLKITLNDYCRIWKWIWLMQNYLYMNMCMQKSLIIRYEIRSFWLIRIASAISLFVKSGSQWMNFAPLIWIQWPLLECSVKAEEWCPKILYLCSLILNLRFRSLCPIFTCSQSAQGIWLFMLDDGWSFQPKYRNLVVISFNIHV